MGHGPFGGRFHGGFESSSSMSMSMSMSTSQSIEKLDDSFFLKKSISYLHRIQTRDPSEDTDKD
jgi:hypothetical protein